MANKKSQFNVRIDNELIDWLKKHAKESHRSVPSQLEYILKKEKLDAKAQHHSAN